jgi:3-methyladenine DNA glycosylase AlkD
MERILTEDEKEMVINFGAFGYNEEQMSNIIGWDLEEVKELMKDKSSQFAKNYAAGNDKVQYVIDMKLFEMASGGDLKALQKFERRRDSD